MCYTAITQQRTDTYRDYCRTAGWNSISPIRVQLTVLKAGLFCRGHKRERVERERRKEGERHNNFKQEVKGGESPYAGALSLHVPK